MNWPYVSRRRYDQALQQIAQARLELEVERAEVLHLRERKLEMVGTLAKAAIELKAAHKERDNWREAFVLADGGPEIVVGVE